jgi:hypothetical protein
VELKLSTGITLTSAYLNFICNNIDIIITIIIIIIIIIIILVAYMGQINSYTTVTGKPQERRPRGRIILKWILDK